MRLHEELDPTGQGSDCVLLGVVYDERVGGQRLGVGYGNGHILGPMEEAQQGEVDTKGFYIRRSIPNQESAECERQSQESSSNDDLEGLQLVQ